jgi:hypothetical protein
VTARLLALAATLLASLGFRLCPLGDTGEALPAAVPRCAPGGAYLPLVPLGLPGHYTPQTGGEP